MNDDCELVNRANRDRIFIITSSRILNCFGRDSWNGFMDTKYGTNARNAHTQLAQSGHCLSHSRITNRRENRSHTSECVKIVFGIVKLCDLCADALSDRTSKGALNNNASSFFHFRSRIRKCIFSLFSLPHRIIFFPARWKLSVKTIRRVLFINTCIVFLLICTDIMDFLTFNRSACWSTAFERLVKSWSEEFLFAEKLFFCSFYDSENNKQKIDFTSKRHKSDGNRFSIECLSLHISTSLLIHTNTRRTIVNRPHNVKRFDGRVENDEKINTQMPMSSKH